jgi:hypothetical protein
MENSFETQLTSESVRDGVDTRKQETDNLRVDTITRLGMSAVKQDKRPSFMEPFPKSKKKVTAYRKQRILKKMLHWKQLDLAEKKVNAKKGANKYAFEFMKMNAGKFVRVKDVQEYCSEQHKKHTGRVFGDPPRSFEILRKDKLPLEWDEFKIGNEKFVKYAPHKKQQYSQEILNAHSTRKDGFSKKVIDEKLEQYGYKCAITGLPISEGALAADHWIPKEQGGKSEPGNCVILNKVLNEKKNNMMPIQWFCEGPMKNFMNVCISAGMDKEQVRQEMMKYLVE